MWLVAPETRAQASSATEEGRGCEQGQEQAQAKANQGVQGEGIVAPALVIVSPISSSLLTHINNVHYFPETNLCVYAYTT